jgi:ribosomal protein L29
MPTTPEEWLPLLTKKLDDRQPRIATNRRYSRGDAPLPEMSRNLRASWEAFQKKSRTDMAGTLCESMAGRIVPRAVIVGEKENDEVKAARKVWRNNRLDVVFGEAIYNALSVSIGYIILGTRNGQPIITSEEPEMVITQPDPAQPWRAIAALKAWRDSDAEKDYAIVWANGLKQWFDRSLRTPEGGIRGESAGGWSVLADRLETYSGELPVYAVENEHGVAEFEPHIDVIDRINLGKLQRLVVTAMQAYKQRMLEGGLPKIDNEGHAINYDSMFEAAPGALWDLPEGVKVVELSGEDIRPLLEGEKTDLRDFAMVTRTPIDVFIPDNQSATGAENSQKGEIQKAKKRIARFGSPMEAAILGALRVLGLDTEETVHVQFEKPEHVGLSEKMAAAAQARTAGKSLRWIDKHIMGMTPEEIAQEESDLAEEQLAAATLLGVAAQTPITQNEPQTPTIDVEALKAKSDAMGVLIRSGATPESAANEVGLTNIRFSGAVPVTLRVPEAKASSLEDK